MAQVTFNNNSYDLEDQESVLDCLLRHDVAVSYSCKSGTCHSCMMQAKEGDVPLNAQKGLKPSFVKRKLFLACQCQPENDLEITEPGDADFRYKTRITQKSWLNDTVLKIIMITPEGFQGEPGQYVSLINPDLVARSYSIANNPVSDGVIELHVRILSDGIMSQWLLKDEAMDCEVTLQGPLGDCVYTADEEQVFPMLMVGTGTGLAPLYGVLKEALARKHKGDMQLFHGALKAEDLYLVDDLKALAEAHDNFTYVPCVLNGDAGQGYETGDIKEAAVKALGPQKAQTRLYICGAPEMVSPMKTEAFLAGLATKNILMDAFIASK